MSGNSETSLVILKPDALERRLAGEIIKRLEELQLTLVDVRVVVPSDQQLTPHYPDSLAETIGEKSRAAGTDINNDPVAYGKMVLSWNRAYMKRGPVLVMMWEGSDAIARIRAAIGNTDPVKAAPGTIRGDLGIDSIQRANEECRGTENLIHASGSTDEAKNEIEIWFGQ